VLQHFGYEGKPKYHGGVVREFQLVRCEVHVDIPINAKQSSWAAWSTSATTNGMHDTVEMAAHRALTEFYEQHLMDTTESVLALFPVWDQSD
jgi:hypothetical protein